MFVPAANGRGVAPTPRALELRGRLSDALGILRDMVRGPNGFEPGTSRRTFVLAIQEQPAVALTPHLVRSVLAEAPMVR